MSDKKPYTIVSAENIQEFNEKVNEFIFEGYEPLGGIAVHGNTFLQAMLLNALAAYSYSKMVSLLDTLAHTNAEVQSSNSIQYVPIANFNLDQSTIDKLRSIIAECLSA